MGSVIDFIECPHCKREAHSDFYYKTGEEYIFCQNCGYSYSASWRRDKNGELVTKDGTDNYSFDNLFMDEIEKSNPFGAFRLKPYHSIGTQCGILSSEEEYNQFKTSISLDPEIEYASVSRFINDEIVVEDIVDNGPETDSAGFKEENRL